MATLKYHVTADYESHTRGGELNVELSGDGPQQLLRDLSATILKYQNKGANSVQKLAKAKYGKKATIKELTLVKIDLSDEFGETLDLCYECGKVLKYGDECPKCGNGFLIDE